MADRMTLQAAAAAMREAMRETVERHSVWYLMQGGLMVLAGMVALVYPVISSVAVVILLGWLLIVSGIFQSISLIGTTHVPHFWLQLVSVVLSIVVGFLFLQHPGEGLFALTLLLVVFFMVGGMSKIVFSLTIKPFRTGAGSSPAVWSGYCCRCFSGRCCLSLRRGSWVCLSASS